MTQSKRRFYSNDGRGPGVARIIREDDESVWLEWWTKHQSRKTRFTLPRKFFYGPSCGWKPAKDRS